MADRQEWTAVQGIDGHALIAPMNGLAGSEVAAFSYICRGCGKPHIFINSAFDGLQMAVGLDPTAARTFAMALLAGADSVDPQVKQ